MSPDSDKMVRHSIDQVPVSVYETNPDASEGKPGQEKPVHETDGKPDKKKLVNNSVSRTDKEELVYNSVSRTDKEELVNNSASRTDKEELIDRPDGKPDQQELIYKPDVGPDQQDLIHEPDPDYIYGSGARAAADRWRDGNLHTLDEYLALPDDRRVELIDGIFYDMAAPSGIHQKIALRLWRELENCIEEKGSPCEAQAAPFDVCLDKYTVVQPDVMVFCEDPSQALGTRATAAPDLVIEVLSPGTASKDRLIKRQKYREHGVKELWLVSPVARQIEVYLFFKGENTPRIYTFSDKVPVHFSDDLPEGNCEIDFPTVTRGIPLLLS